MPDASTVGVTTRLRIACAILLLLMAGRVSATKAVRATPHLTLDGVGSNTVCQATNCESQLLTTTQGQDVVLLLAECGYSNCPVAITSIMDSSGLTFTQRVSFSPMDKLWEYYARATLPLRSENITVVFSCISYCFGLHGIQVLAIKGANTRGIFDLNPSMPATALCPDEPCSVSALTSTVDFVVAITAINDSGPCGGLPGSSDYLGGVPGFTTITTAPGYASNFEVDYAITTTPLSNVVFNCKGTSAMAIVIDGISFRGAFGN